jgi:hypothetical protein
MPDKIAALIKEQAKELSEATGSFINFDDSFDKQAEDILKNDKRDFQRLGTNFLMPKGLYNSLNIGFNPFLAEPLLREGSLLLDRCLQQRKEYQDLHTKSFEARLQIYEMIKLSNLAEEELREIDLVQTEIVKAEKNTLLNQGNNADSNAKKLSSATKTWDQESTDLDRVINNATVSNLLANSARTGPIGANQFEVTPNPSSEASFNYVREGARKQSGIQRKYHKLQMDVEENQYKGIQQTSTDTIAKIAQEVELKNKLKEFKEKRNELARLVALSRAFQMTKENGALNFKEQMRPIKERFRNDLIAAYLRLSSANEGFQKLYVKRFSIPIEFPAKVRVEPVDLEIPELIDPLGKANLLDFEDKIDLDKLVTWTQYTNTWLASFLDEQQLVTRSFSLKKLLGVDNLQEAAENGSWRFKLSESDFPFVVKKQQGQPDETIYGKFVRLRSFAVQIDSGNKSGSWNISITLPESALVRYLDKEINTEAEKNPKTINQSHIGTLFLGRVNERSYAVVPEGAAPPKLYNASPIGEDSDSGKWTISVIGSGSTSGASIDDIRDIDIHLTVALV